MTEYICHECTGRGGVPITFKVAEGPDPYEGDVCCPVCAQYGHVEEL